MRLNVDRDLCCVNGECAYAAPNVFRVEDDELVYDAEPEPSERAAVEDAVMGCPMQAISIQE